MQIRLGVAVVAAGLLLACGGGAASDCSAANCAGCCDERGACVAGDFSLACGVGGGACRTCTGLDACTGGFCLPPSGPSCTRKTCEGMGATCGSVPDGCGGTLQCGSCGEGETCGGGGMANVCGVGTCEASTCESLGKDCGLLSDGCSAVLQCGTCTGDATCGGGGTPNVCGTGCMPTTCAAQGAQCGNVPDGCGGMLSCGTCAGGQSCGGGGAPNVCGEGCTPTTCAAQGAECGSVSDGCGGTLSCGTCTGGESCGGSGEPNVCGSGCMPTTCAAQGKNCGTLPDGCGGTLSCGSCSGVSTCGGGGVDNVCGCTPTTCAAAGKNCGVIPNGCGGTLSCGTCSGGLSCGGGGVANVCGAPCTGTLGTCGVVMSQVYGGGGNFGAPYTHDFIEFFNAGGAPVTLTGWSVQYSSGTGTAWQVTPLTGTIAPGGYFLLQQGAGNTPSGALPPPDQVAGVSLAAANGKLALVSDTTALAGLCPTGPQIVDFVGYGLSVSCFETSPAPPPSNTDSISRGSGGCLDTQNNANDFSAGVPMPRNSSSPANLCP